ncbi:hypothetical protein A2U01_0019620, partial [Trifolium medium]|nr:hypothetical protein [Trifolium medium]
GWAKDCHPLNVDVMSLSLSLLRVLKALEKPTFKKPTRALDRLKFGSLSKAYITEERLSGHVARNVLVLLQLEMFEFKINNSLFF